MQRRSFLASVVAATVFGCLPKGNQKRLPPDKFMGIYFPAVEIPKDARITTALVRWDGINLAAPGTFPEPDINEAIRQLTNA